jgi:hypothetical protein
VHQEFAARAGEIIEDVNQRVAGHR